MINVACPPAPTAVTSISHPQYNPEHPSLHLQSAFLSLFVRKPALALEFLVCSSSRNATSPQPAMMERQAVIGEADMLQTIQQDALCVAGKALDEFDATNSTQIARFIKKEFDRSYGPGWQCIVGTDFGSFVTHHCGCFIYFSIGGSLAILLFRGGVAPESVTGQLSAIDTEKT